MKKLRFAIIAVLAATACYSAATVKASGEAPDICHNDSDCPRNYICVKNVNITGPVGECIHRDSYNSWVDNQLEEALKLKNKKKLEEAPLIDEPEANNPNSRWWLPPAEKDK